MVVGWLECWAGSNLTEASCHNDGRIKRKDRGVVTEMTNFNTVRVTLDNQQ